jgi:acetyltransferase-like isoleucine patch superfamily enzyme
LKIVDSGASLSLGEFVFIGKGTEFDVKEKVSVGAHTVIAPGCFITDHGHGLSRLSRIDEQSCQSQEVKIGSDVWIGANVVILPGVSIGNGAVIGASAVITKDIPDYAIAVGVPARVIRHRS